MPKQAKPFKEGAGWAMRRRILGQDLYVCGQKSATAARQEMEKLVDSLKGEKKPFGLGSQLTTLGQALQDFGRVHLPRLKGARQEKDRINRYLRCIGLDVVELREPAPRQGTEKDGVVEKGKRGRRYFDVELVATGFNAPRKIPRGLKQHRKDQALNSFESDRLRMLLAGTAVGKVTRHQVQRLMDRLTEEGASPATVALERALLRRFFNYAHRTWHWSDLRDNPAQGLTLPPVDETPRMSGLLSVEDEQRLLAAAMEHCRGEHVAPLLELLVETGRALSKGAPYPWMSKTTASTNETAPCGTGHRWRRLSGSAAKAMPLPTFVPVALPPVPVREPTCQPPEGAGARWHRRMAGCTSAEPGPLHLAGSRRRHGHADASAVRCLGPWPAVATRG